jgi:hypothetical protein
MGSSLSSREGDALLNVDANGSMNTRNGALKSDPTEAMKSSSTGSPLKTLSSQSFVDHNQNQKTNSIDNPKICLNCAKESQSDFPTQDSRSSAHCAEQYASVESCMKHNKGQIAPCTKEWKEFQLCHEKQKLTK